MKWIQNLILLFSSSRRPSDDEQLQLYLLKPWTECCWGRVKHFPVRSPAVISNCSLWRCVVPFHCKNDWLLNIWVPPVFAVHAIVLFAQLWFCVALRWRLWTVLTRAERCSRGQGSFPTISLSRTPTPRPPAPPTTEPCLPTSVTLSMPGTLGRESGNRFSSRASDPLCAPVLTCGVPPGTEERTTCSACWRDTASLRQVWPWGRVSTTTPTSLDRPLAWPHPSTTRCWSTMTVSHDGANMTDNYDSNYDWD